MSETGKDTENKSQEDYEKQYLIYKKETLDKINAFRQARSQWAASGEESQEAKSHVLEGVEDTDHYQGRCYCLRKIGLKTNRLRSHYKTVRPLKCFTLKRNIFETVEDYETEVINPNVIVSQNVFLDIKEPEKSKKHTDFMNLESQPITQVVENKEETQIPSNEIETKENNQKINNKARKIPLKINSKFEYFAREKKKKLDEIDDYVKEEEKPKKKGPSKRVLENLKASKQGRKGIKSCKCDDDKEVTLVIKGFCLCDKLNLKEFHFSKLYKENRKPHLQKLPSKVHKTDSLEVYRKRLNGKPEISEGKESDDSILLNEKDLKTVSFEKEIHRSEQKMKESASVITLFKNETEKRSQMGLTKEQLKKLKLYKNSEISLFQEKK